MSVSFIQSFGFYYMSSYIESNALELSILAFNAFFCVILLPVLIFQRECLFRSNCLAFDSGPASNNDTS